MSDLEWFPLYVNRFLNSRRLRRMSAECIGIYTLLLCESWEGGPIPDDDSGLAFLGRCTASDARAVLERCFSLTSEGWISPELEEIRAEQTEKRNRLAEAGRKGGHAKAANRASDATAMLKPGSSNRREEKRIDKTESESLDVEKWEWGDFAGWYRTEGHQLLWMDANPPDWANDAKPWTVERDLSIVKQLRKKGEPLATIKAVIERNREASCMKRFNQLGRWDYWYKAKSELLKSRELQGLGIHVEIKGVA